jgi:hypothetical protein
MTVPIQPGFFVDVTLRRPTGAGSYGTNGEWTDAATTDTTIKGSIQPPTGKELLDVEEAERTRDIRKIYSLTELRTATEGTAATDADLIIFNSLTFKVIRILPWDTPGPALQLPHHKALIKRMDIQ